MSKTDAIWITGASSGIGMALAERFSELNVKIILSSRTIEDKRDSFNSDLFLLKNCDVSNIDSLNSFYNEVSKDFNITCLINNAGTTRFKSALKHTVEEVNSIINTNLLGAIYATKVVLPEMIENNNGTIINIVSVVAEKVFTNSSVYAASKAGLLAFAKGLREEVRNNNIHILNVLPGATNTPIWPGGAVEKFGDKMMKPEDLADVIFKLYKDRKSALVEEVVLRPVTGDL